MKHLKRLAAASAALAVVVSLTACGGVGSPTGANLREKQAHLSDGRTVTCIAYKRVNAGGLSCDWENAR